MGVPLLTHHLVTLALFMLAFWKIETQVSSIEAKYLVAKIAILLALQAVTEQQTFLSLMFCIL
jgi:hypothetical protein